MFLKKPKDVGSLDGTIKDLIKRQRRVGTSFADRGWELTDVTQCLYANMQRRARALLEQRGLLSPPERHVNGAEWIFWAEEPKPDGDR